MRLPVPQSDPARPRPFADASMFGAAKARGLGQVAQGLGDLGAAFAARAERRKKLAEEEEVSRLNRELALKKADMAIRQRKAFEEADPSDPEVSSRFMGSVREDFAALGQTAKTEAGRKFLADQEAGTTASFLVSTDSAAAELAGDRRAAETEDAVAALSAGVVSDPDSFFAAISQLDGALSVLMPAEVPAQKLREQSALVEARIEGLVEVRKRPQQAFDELVRGDYDEYIDGKTKARLLSSARSAIKAEKDYARGLALLEWEDDRGQIALTGDTGRWSREALQSLADDPVEAVRLGRDYDRALSVGRAAATYAEMPLGEIAADVRAAEANMRSATEFGTAKAEAEAKRAAATAIAQSYRDDPAGTAIARYPAAAKAYQNFVENPSSATFERYAVLVQRQQKADLPGANPRVLPTGFSEDVKARLENSATDASRTARYLGTLQSSVGARYWPRVTRDLMAQGAMTPEQYVAASLVQKRPGLARELLETTSLKDEDLRKLAADPGRKDNAQRRANVALEDFRKTLPPRDLPVASAYENSLARLIMTRETKGELLSGTDVKRLAKEMVLDEYKFAGTLRVPKAYDANRVRRGLNQVRDGLTNDRLVSPPGRGDYAARVRAGGYWLTNGDETGARLVDETGAQVIGRDAAGVSGPIIVRWDEVQ